MSEILAMPPIERYRHDHRFHAIVNNMVDMMEQGLCDGATLQQASIVASIEHGMRHGVPICPISRAFMEEQQKDVRGE